MHSDRNTQLHGVDSRGLYELALISLPNAGEPDKIVVVKQRLYHMRFGCCISLSSYITIHPTDNHHYVS